MTTETTIHIFGTLIGTIWQPCDECEKEFDEVFSYDSKPFTKQIDCLRDALLHITNDGDFQHCSIDRAIMRVTKHKFGHTSKCRTVELTGNDENSDLYAHNEHRLYLQGDLS